jgi:hypothetical protein
MEITKKTRLRTGGKMFSTSGHPVLFLAAQCAKCRQLDMSLSLTKRGSKRSSLIVSSTLSGGN